MENNFSFRNTRDRLLLRSDAQTRASLARFSVPNRVARFRRLKRPTKTSVKPLIPEGCRKYFNSDLQQEIISKKYARKRSESFLSFAGTFRISVGFRPGDDSETITVRGNSPTRVPFGNRLVSYGRLLGESRRIIGTRTREKSCTGRSRYASPKFGRNPRRRGRRNVRTVSRRGNWT